MSDAALAFVAGVLAGAAVALTLVGYGVRGGINQIVMLTRYRLGLCRCRMCGGRHVAR
jgi:hypothetical protein